MRHELRRTNDFLVALARYPSNRYKSIHHHPPSVGQPFNEAAIANELALASGPLGGGRAGGRTRHALVSVVAFQAMLHP